MIKLSGFFMCYGLAAGFVVSVCKLSIKVVSEAAAGSCVLVAVMFVSMLTESGTFSLPLSPIVQADNDRIPNTATVKYFAELFIINGFLFKTPPYSELFYDF
jgi:hypothetical protein